MIMRGLVVYVPFCAGILNVLGTSLIVRIPVLGATIMRGYVYALFAGILSGSYVDYDSVRYYKETRTDIRDSRGTICNRSLCCMHRERCCWMRTPGRVLYGKNETTPMAMASTTKIMTCILVLENAKVDEIVSVSAYAATMPKVKLYVKCQEHYTVRELLFSLMLESHNDAAVVLGEYIGAKLVGRDGGDFRTYRRREQGGVT